MYDTGSDASLNKFCTVSDPGEQLLKSNISANISEKKNQKPKPYSTVHLRLFVVAAVPIGNGSTEVRISHGKYSVQAVFDTITNLLSEEVVKKTNAIFSFTLKGIFRLVLNFF